MSNIKSWMADIEDFCNLHTRFHETPQKIEEKAEQFFNSIEAGKYAKTYLSTVNNEKDI